MAVFEEGAEGVKTVVVEEVAIEEGLEHPRALNHKNRKREPID